MAWQIVVVIVVNVLVLDMVVRYCCHLFRLLLLLLAVLLVMFLGRFVIRFFFLGSGPMRISSLQRDRPVVWVPPIDAKNE